jgi:hypothetical protein
MIQVEVYQQGVIQTRLGDIPVALETQARIQWFPVRAMSRLLGVDEDRQAQVVKDAYAEALREIPMQLPVGMRRVLCIRRKEFALWIAGINPKRCKLGAQKALEEYRVELLAAADQLFWKHVSIGSSTALTAPSTSATTVSVHAEIDHACLKCGAAHHLVYVDGVVTTTLQEEE